MFNSRNFHNSRPDGFSVLELPEQRFAPLRHTALTGHIVGPLATLRLTQTFALEGPDNAPPVEAVYRFPLPGDAAVTGVRVRFGEVEIQTLLRERARAEAEYEAAKQEGQQAALVTRESPDVFSLAVAGLQTGQEIQVETSYVQLARVDRNGWSLRVPLTTAPRYVREGESESRHARGQPLALLRDPDHRFSLNLTLPHGQQIESPTHELTVEDAQVQLKSGNVLPDRDFLLRWQPQAAQQPTLTTWVHTDPAHDAAYFLALAVPPVRAAKAPGLPREVVLLIDHSGSMEGPKWEAADWAVERFLAGLNERDTFALGVFHNHTSWYAKEPRHATPREVKAAVQFLHAHTDNGGTELGTALDQALDLPRTVGDVSRHVLVVTDAEVTDVGPILQMVDAECEHPERRRVSVLCIDAAPNATLATDLAERGGGVSRFLTSDPSQDDVTTALDEVLEDWAAPEQIGLTLEVNRSSVTTVGKLVSVGVPGPVAIIDMGDPPAGRPVWVTGRVSLAGDALHVRLATPNETLVENGVIERGEMPGIPALFAADRLRRLEYLMNAGLGRIALQTELERLGYEAAGVESSEAVKPILVRESLASGLPCSETAFVAVRTEAGQRVGETLVVANAMPSGWPDAIAGALPDASMPLFAMAAAPAPSPSGIGGFVRGLLRKQSLPSALASPRPGVDSTPPPTKGKLEHVMVVEGVHVPAANAVVYDSDRDSSPFHSGRLRGLRLKTTTSPVDADVAFLIFVGDLSTPRARIRVADLVAGGRRPLNLQRTANQPMRIVVEDPNQSWSQGVPALELLLEWD